MKLKTQRQVQLIVSSFRKVFKTGDIEHLTKPAYNFIYLASGFIAHYNLYGFQDEYRNVDDLKRAIIANVVSNQWTNFHPGERDYDYYMQKRDIYNLIVDEVVNASGNPGALARQVEVFKTHWAPYSVQSSDVVL